MVLPEAGWAKEGFASFTSMYTGLGPTWFQQIVATEVKGRVMLRKTTNRNSGSQGGRICLDLPDRNHSLFGSYRQVCKGYGYSARSMPFVLVCIEQAGSSS